MFKFIMTVCTMLSLLLIGCGNEKEIYYISDIKSKNPPQIGHIVDINKENNSILVVSNLNEKEAKKIHIDTKNNKFLENKNSTWYYIEKKEVVDILKLGQKIKIFNNNAIDLSQPSFTEATKIIVYKK